ncbi:MAG: DNA replication and repair protein RecF [Chloroflexi bacterium]|nr:DNA replication and repair protein RecF [Chloroflexota bacterium]
MHLARLELTNVRTFPRLDLALAPGAHLVIGANASGKSNLLEAIALLATTRSGRAGGDVDLVSWQALAEEPVPAARLAAQVETAQGRTELEIAVIAGGAADRGIEPTRASRRFRVNGVARRASDLIGRLRVVLFAAEDLRIVEGPPGLRRRYLDITLAQLDPTYVRAAQRYARVLQQRNGLLRLLAARRGKPDELDFWDDELASAGAVLIAARAAALRYLARDAAERYAELASPVEALTICYRPALPDELRAAIGEHDLAPRMRSALEAGRRTDIDRGLTRIGPHRDDIAFAIDGRDAGTFASRGQQRTIALALRLAEVTLSTSRTGDAPVLLLDDILSEIDAERRRRVLEAAYGVDQVILTTPDADRPTPGELPQARRYRLADGKFAPA